MPLRPQAQGSPRVWEWVIGVYFAYASVLALTLRHLTLEVRLRTLAANALLFVLFFCILRIERSHPREWLGMVREWGALPLALLAYKEMGWFAPPSHDYHLEMGWITVDRLVLRQWGVRHAIESVPLLPAVLQLSYVLVYALPFFVVAMVYVYRRRPLIDVLLTIYLLGLFLAYAQFPFWPSEPPRTVFPGDDAPTVDTWIRSLNLWMLGSYGIHTSVFPSAHVSGAFAAVFGIWQIFRDVRWLRWTTLIYAILIAVSTVYGRYHYLVDALAGLAVAVLASLIGRWLLALRYGPELLMASPPGRTQGVVE
jgi:membrane-associated phospholipid phosphatase